MKALFIGTRFEAFKILEKNSLIESIVTTKKSYVDKYVDKSKYKFRYVNLETDLVLEDDVEFKVVSDTDFSINTSKTPTAPRPGIPDKTKFVFNIANPCNMSSEFLGSPGTVSPIAFAQNFPTLTEQPSYVLELPHSPRMQSSDISSSYKIRHKDGLNADLVKPTFVYEKMNDQSAVDMLYLMESSKGFYPFRYVSPEPYAVSFFNCAKWSHEFVYKNNHKITLDLSRSEVSRTVAEKSPLMKASGLFDSGISISASNNFQVCPFGAESIDDPKITAKGEITISNDSSIPNKIYSIGLGYTGSVMEEDVPFSLFYLKELGFFFYSIEL